MAGQIKMEWEKSGKWAGSYGPMWISRHAEGRIIITGSRRRVGHGPRRQYDNNYRTVFYPAANPADYIEVGSRGNLAGATEMATEYMSKLKAVGNRVPASEIRV